MPGKKSTGTFSSSTTTFWSGEGLPEVSRICVIRASYRSAADRISVVLAGTNGEAATLKAHEKASLVRTLREKAGSQLPITVGCMGGCTRDVIDDTVAMSEAGADFALILVPSYFHFALDQMAIMSFFEEVADASPLPVCIYNFPNVVSGLDINSEMLSRLGAHPNIVAVKLTCGGIAKVARAAAEFPREIFTALAGQSDCKLFLVRKSSANSGDRARTLFVRWWRRMHHWAGKSLSEGLYGAIRLVDEGQARRRRAAAASARICRVGICERRHQWHEMGGR